MNAFHLAVFAGAKTDSTLNENAPSVQDQALTRSANSRYIMPEPLSILYASVMNDTITRARITAPSLRNLGLPEIYPVTVSDDPATNPKGSFWGTNGPKVQKNEEVGVETSNGASTVDRVHALVVFHRQTMPVPAGQRMTIVGTSAQTLVLDEWTSGGITLDQVLPPGRYAVIGMHVTCNDAYAARLVFPGGYSLRPGCPVAMAAGGFVEGDYFRNGRLGEWGRFDHTAQPQLELIGNAAGAETATVVLDLVALAM
jgi:hypothetical protein